MAIRPRDARPGLHGPAPRLATLCRSVGRATGTGTTPPLGIASSECRPHQRVSGGPTTSWRCRECRARDGSTCPSIRSSKRRRRPFEQRRSKRPPARLRRRAQHASPGASSQPEVRHCSRRERRTTTITRSAACVGQFQTSTVSTVEHPFSNWTRQQADTSSARQKSRSWESVPTVTG